MNLVSGDPATFTRTESVQQSPRMGIELYHEPKHSHYHEV
jgi:hypothetical protein